MSRFYISLLFRYRWMILTTLVILSIILRRPSSLIEKRIQLKENLSISSWSSSITESENVTKLASLIEDEVALKDTVIMKEFRGQSKVASRSNCGNYDGVLLIDSGPKLAAAGTIFFQYVINQILYAERYNLIPLIHLSSNLKFIYDKEVHGSGEGIDLILQQGIEASWLGNHTYPGPPKKISMLKTKIFHFPGTGIWNSYFFPVSNLSMIKKCPNLPLIQLTASQIKPGLHAHCPWAVRSWRYGDLPSHIALLNLTSKEWYWPMRKRGHEIVQKYIHIRPEWLRPSPTNQNCIGVHVRHSDKKAERKQTPLLEFYPYLQAFADGGGLHLYLATDSLLVHRQLINDWNNTLNVTSPTDIIRSTDRTATFKLTPSHHRTNLEVLQDIYALSRCSFFIHGKSAVSEAVMYLRLEMHHYSVDLEDPERYTPAEFRKIVDKRLQQIKH